MKRTKDPIVRMLDAVEIYKRKLQNCEESNPIYWSGGDSWVSIDDINSATDWQNKKLASFVKKYLRRIGYTSSR